MYLVDTSVWIDYLRDRDRPHVAFLEELREHVEFWNDTLGLLVTSDLRNGWLRHRQGRFRTGRTLCKGDGNYSHRPKR